jgi:hypothetical protein
MLTKLLVANEIVKQSIEILFNISINQCLILFAVLKEMEPATLAVSAQAKVELLVETALQGNSILDP